MACLILGLLHTAEMPEILTSLRSLDWIAMACEKFCDICYNDQSVEFKFENASNLLPGSEGSFKFNQHLRVFFIITKLFRLPATQFLKLFLKSPKRNDGGKEENGRSSNKLQYSRICGKCEQLVNEALELHLQVVEMDKKIAKLGNELLEMKVVGERLRQEEERSRRKAEKMDENSKKLEAKKDEMIDLTLACLGGLLKSKKTPSPTRYLKGALRKRKPISKTCETNETMEELPVEEPSVPRDPLEPDIYIEIKTENEDDLVFHEDLTGFPEENLVSYSLEDDHVENSIDNPDSDRDYVPTSDEEMAVENDNDDDEDYTPARKLEKPRLQRMSARKKNVDFENMELEDEDSDEDWDSKEKIRKPRRQSSRKKTEQDPDYNEQASELSDTDCSVDCDDEINDDVQETMDLEKQLKIVDGKKLVLSHAEADLNRPSGCAFDYQCPECHKILGSRPVLFNHARKMHGIEMHYSCPKCPELKFARKSDLVDHRRSVHGNTCELCGKVLKEMSKLAYHYKSIHNIKLTYTCPICKLQFEGRGEFRTHKMEHKISKAELKRMPEGVPKTEEEKMWASNPCTECGKAFLSAERLDSHLYHVHHEKLSKEEKLAKRRKCYWCCRYFTFKQRFLLHRLKEHPEKVVEFPCDNCSDKIFKTTEELTDHFSSVHPNEIIHTCKFCRWPFLSNTQLKVHMDGHVNHKPDPEVTDAEKLLTCEFNCWFCWELFPTPEKLDKHVKTNRRHRPREGLDRKIEFPCDDCNCTKSKEPFENVEELRRHLWEDHGDKEVKTCERCTWPFTSKDYFDLHQMNHVPRRAGRFKCPDCMHIAVILPALRDHWNTIHGVSLQIHSCTYCDKKFTTRSGMSIHRTQMHRDEVCKSYQSTCDQCGKVFKSEQNLNLHIRLTHKTAKCRDCGMEFESTPKLYTHRRKAHGHGHLCPICGQVFNSRTFLQSHMARHASRPKFECHLCGRKFRTVELLKKHVSKIHENSSKPKVMKKFTCPECGKGYSRKDSLDDHFRVNHTNERHRVWECEKCGKRFKRPRAYKDHVETVNECVKTVTLLQAPEDAVPPSITAE